MTRTELLAVLANPESSGIEFTRDTIDVRQLAKELVAFANFDGGAVLLGVDDDGSVIGITRDRLEEWVMGVCRDKIRPPLVPFFEIVRDVEPGKDVAVVRADPGYTVHSVWHHQHHTYYVRVGSTSREASREELERLLQRRGGLRAELRPVPGTGVDDLDMKRLRRYFAEIRAQPAPATDDTAGWEHLLWNTELMVDGQDRRACSVAGVLLFGRKPNRWLPHAGIDAAAYPGTEKGYASIERSQLRGPYVALRDPYDEVVESGVVEQAIAFVRRTAPPTAHVDQGMRVDRAAIPDEVIREAVVNALVHRDYLITTVDIELSVFTDRVELISPGRLPNGVTPDRMRTGVRAARNQLLKDVMRDHGYLEHMGMGVPRLIVAGMRAHNGTEPDLIEDGERFVLRLER